MASNEYSADSPPLPQSASPSSGKMGAFKTAYLPASFLQDVLPAPTTSMMAGTNGYIGKSADLPRRLSEHGAVRRKAGQSGTSTPTHTSLD